MATRYYAEHTLVSAPASRGWQVFDRQNTNVLGEVQAIAVCASRAVAFRIRDALNAQEKTKL